METASKIKTDKKEKSKVLFIKPFMYKRPSISSVVIRMLVLLSIQAIMLLFTKSYSAFTVIIASTLGAVCASAINYLISHDQPFNIMNIITQGMMIGLLLPEKYPLVIVFFISFTSLSISRCLVFKSINSWINCSAVAVIIAWIIGASYFPPFTITADLIPLRNSSLYLIQNGSFPIYSFDASITAFLNSTVFDWFKVTIPEGYISLLWDSHSIIPAFRFNIITIISSIIIFSDNAFSGIIPSLFLIIYGLLVRLFAPLMFGGYFNQGDILLAIFSSGTLFCATFMIQWYGTIPTTVTGKVVLGILSGILAFFIVGCGTSPIGIAYTVLITNIISMFIKAFEEKQNLVSTVRVVNKIAAKGGN
ncbi:MAG: RnfABCDGE type electron transport complex subunit D [Treponema sp.]|nr:RnfABCDGE type electron transport complex subunit D [Treponema sp.]